MKLHLPKLLLTAVLAVCSVAYAAVTDITEYTIGSSTYAVSTGESMKLSQNDGNKYTPQNATYNVVGNGSRVTLLQTSDMSTDKGTLIFAKGTLEDGSVVNGGQLFLNAWDKRTVNEVLKISNDLVLGVSSWRDGADNVPLEGTVRFHEACANKNILLTGTITLADTTIFAVTSGSTQNYVSGVINGAGQTLQIGGKAATDKTPAGSITLAGGGSIGTLNVTTGVVLSGGLTYDLETGNITGYDATAAKTYTIGALTGSGTYTIESNATVILSSTINSGTLVNKGSLVVEDWSGFDFETSGGEDATENGLVDMTKTYQILSGSATLADPTSTFTYGGQSHNIANGYAVTEGKVYVIAKESATIDLSDVDSDAAKADKFLLKGGTLNLAAGSLSSELVTYTGGSVNLESGATFTLTEADNSTNATSLLVNTTGAKGSVLEIAANANFGKVFNGGNNTSTHTTDFEGKWVVTNGATLKLGGLDGGWNNNYQVDLSKLEALELNGGNLRFFGGNSTISKLLVSQTATLNVYEMISNDSWLNINELELDANLTIDTEWRSRINISALTGAATLSFDSSRNDGNGAVINIHALAGFTGQLDINNGSHTSDAVYITTAENSTVTIKGDSNSTIQKVTLANGAKVAYDARHNAYTYTINNVDVVDKGTIAIEAGATFYQSCVNIENLTNAEGSASGELTLISNFRNNKANVFNLNGGDFAGVIAMNTNSTDNRPYAFNINDATVAEDAEIKIANVSNNKGENPHTIALGIGDETVTVKGISGGGNTAIYSGAQAFETQSFASDGTSRTLEINTAGGNYTADVAVKENINLVKSGAGKQTFSGDMSAFNGTVKVSGGSLEFSKADGNTTVSSLTLDGGALDVSGTLTLSNVTVDLSQYTAGTNIELVKAGTLSADALSVSYANGATTVGNYTGTLAQDGNSLWLTWKDTTSTVSSITTSVSTKEGWYTLSTDGTTTTLTLTVDASLAGLAADGSVMVHLLTDEQLSAIMGDKNYNPYVLLELTDSDKNTVAADAFDRVVFIKGETGQNYWGEMVGGQLMYNVERIPEPASATLSLAALMMLCARRRRRQK